MAAVVLVMVMPAFEMMEVEMKIRSGSLPKCHGSATQLIPNLIRIISHVIVAEWRRVRMRRGWWSWVGSLR